MKVDNRYFSSNCEDDGNWGEVNIDRLGVGEYNSDLSLLALFD